jgi:hypothetical protein
MTWNNPIMLASAFPFVMLWFGRTYAPRLDVEQLRDGVDGILFSETLAAEGAVVFAKDCQLGLEGTSYRVFLCLAASQGKARVSADWRASTLKRGSRRSIGTTPGAAEFCE